MRAPATAARSSSVRPYARPAGIRCVSGYHRVRALVGPQAEGAGQVDDADAGLDERGRQLGGRLVGQREEDDVGVARERGGVERRDGAVPDARQRGQASRRGAGEAEPDEVAAVIVTAGCRASSRSSSWPV